MNDSETMQEVRRRKEAVYEKTKHLSPKERRIRSNNNSLWLEAKAKKRARISA